MDDSFADFGIFIKDSLETPGNVPVSFLPSSNDCTWFKRGDLHAIEVWFNAEDKPYNATFLGSFEYAPMLSKVTEFSHEWSKTHSNDQSLMWLQFNKKTQAFWEFAQIDGQRTVVSYYQACNLGALPHGTKITITINDDAHECIVSGYANNFHEPNSVIPDWYIEAIDRVHTMSRNWKQGIDGGELELGWESDNVS